ncbi:hypothetical protein HMF7854_00160 [Sphingomonas ginkgonis]|uniref:Uncharacterized protein n=1 Tax=Sphingomonas ginkgonis TaxID=2315330 RepID=A0A3R9Y3K9_9SPHN|nr:hypothetical protein [Sphingomonas ginkgonis]RST29421.1 hypothetical protein HMF7854_00160 [Sphingomonas ginkgonis]
MNGNENWYWNIIYIGALAMFAVLLWVVFRSKSRGAEMNDDQTNRATKDLYRAEHDAHKDEPGSGL